MPLFFDTHSRYPRSAIAFRIIYGAQILLYLGTGISLYLNNSKLTSEDGKKFDNAWSNIISEAKLNQEVQKLQRIYAALKIENSKLLKIYSNKIGMQWKV